MKTYVVLFVFSFTLRLAVLWQLRGVDPVPAGTDMLTYYNQALSPDWPPAQALYWHPLMPLFIRASFVLGGISTWSPRLLMCLVGSLLPPVVAAIGARLFDRQTGLVAGLLTATYRAGVLYSGVILDVSVTSLALAVAFLACLQPSRRRSVVAALSLFLGVLGRAVLLVPALGFAAWLAVRRRWQAAVVLLATLAVCLVPVTARNLHYGSLAIVTTNGAPNFWIGNHPGARGSYDVCRPDCPSWPAYNAIRQGDGRFIRHSLDYIASQPLDWLLLTFRKAAAFVFLPDAILPNNVDVREAASHAWLLRVLPGYGLFLLLSLAGLVVLRRRWREFVPLAVFYVPYALATILFFVIARFRVPVATAFILLSAVVLVDIWRKVTHTTQSYSTP